MIDIHITIAYIGPITINKDGKHRPMNTNTIVLSGRIALDMELRHTAAGDPVTTLRLASDFAKDKSLFIDVSIWGKQAESVCTHLKKGSKVTVTGYLTQRQYENKTGIKVTVTEIKARYVEFGEKLVQNNGTQPPSQPSHANAAPSPSTFGPDDDLPF